MIATGDADGWGQCHTVGRVAFRTKLSAPCSRFGNQQILVANAFKAVNGLTSDDENTVNGAFGPLEQPR